VDSALYLSKQAGRNQVFLASAGASALEFDLGREEQILNAVHALAATVDAKDHRTYGHSKKAAEYAAQIAHALGYSSDKIAMLKAAALLHDIGKIRVPDSILLKPGSLTDSEWIAMREHPKFGVVILKHIKSLGGCLPVIQHHHEHFDGRGYPAGLRGDNIPLDARILAIADAYDAMTSPRLYRSNVLHHQEALAEIVRCSGSYFDPEIVSIFAALWEPLNCRTLTNSAAR
jgi:putative nucleotidyltransferase with HDIG domain